MALTPEFRITGYMSSHKQFSLSSKFGPDEITKLTRCKPTSSTDGKCKYQWNFFASWWSVNERGDNIEITLPCAIWDYYDARWSAWGPPAVFRQLGLLPPVEDPEALPHPATGEAR